MACQQRTRACRLRKSAHMLSKVTAAAAAICRVHQSRSLWSALCSAKGQRQRSSFAASVVDLARMVKAPPCWSDVMPEDQQHVHCIHLISRHTMGAHRQRSS